MEGLFKTAVGGFKKEDVLAYIDRQETEFREKEADYKKQLRQSAEQLDQIKRERDDREQKAAGLAESLEQATCKNSELEKQLADAQAQAAAVTEETGRDQADREKQAHEIQSLRQELDRKTDELRAREAAMAHLQEEGHRAEQSQERISRVLMEAQATADRIVADARRKAAGILSRAQEECNRLVETSDAFHRDVASLRSAIGVAAGRLDGTLLTMEDAADKFRATYCRAFETEKPKETPEQPEEETADSGASGARFDFSAAHTQD